METGEIEDSLNEISNADAEKIIKEAKKESKGAPDRVLAEKLQKFFPDVQISQYHKVRKQCDKFLAHYNNALNSAKIKAQRSLNYETMYSLGKKTVSCNSCDKSFKTKAMATTHIQKDHLKEQIQEFTRSTNRSSSIKPPSRSP